MPAFGQSRDEKNEALQPLPKPKSFTSTETNTLPVGNIGIVNLEQKKKPHNIPIKNYNPKEPKITPNIRYTEKQRFRRYKTKTEPNLHSKIEINEEDDIVNKIKEAFGINPEKKNTNYSEEITAPAQFNNGVDEPPEIETKIYSSSVPSGFHNLKGYDEWYNSFNDGVDEPYEGYDDDRHYFDVMNEYMKELFDISPETRQELTFQADPQYEIKEEEPEEYLAYKDIELSDGKIVQVPQIRKKYSSGGYTDRDPTNEELRRYLNIVPEEDIGGNLFGDDEVVINLQPRRLSGAFTPQRTEKSDALDKEIEEMLTPENDIFGTKRKGAGRPLGGHALIRQHLQAEDLSQNRQATINDFKERRRNNIASNKPEMKYRDLMKQDNKNKHSVLQYYNSL